jgi:hypothetical protein
MNESVAMHESAVDLLQYGIAESVVCHQTIHDPHRREWLWSPESDRCPGGRCRWRSPKQSCRLSAEPLGCSPRAIRSSCITCRW